LEFDCEGRPAPRRIEVDLTRDEECSLHLGFFLNSGRSCFGILDITKGSVLYTFTQIRRCDSYLAVFGLRESEHKSDIQIELITGRDLKNVPYVLLEQLL